MNHRQATDTDEQAIRELLNDSSLPSSDCGEHLENFIVIEEKSQIIGAGGLESYGTIGMVRSIVVDPQYRGRGVAKNIYKLIEKMAYGLGINTLYLLTESATSFFEKFGFVIQERSETPKSVKETKQFKELCSSSAMVMCREISDTKGQ